MLNSSQNHLEFDVPPTATSDTFPTPVSAKSRRHFSIDLSLELERQLEMEADSQPNTPAHNATAHNTDAKGDSLDPHILAHIIMQLRQNMAELTKERDDLVQLVAQSTAQEAQAKDALQLMTDKAAHLEEVYGDAKRKMRDDEEAISMLRTKVEESRRGLMRLQSENRRQSVGPMTLDLARAGSVFGTGPPSSKRASFTPMTGTFATRPNGHRRISSQSDHSLDSSDLSGQTLAMPEPSASSSKSARRQSGFFTSRSLPQEYDPLAVELESVRKELITVKDELEETRHELTETKEAKDASDSCVQALREFIADNNVGSPTIGHANLPTDTSGRKPFTGSTGWGFNKLWRVDTTMKPTSEQASVTTPTPTNQMSPATVPLSRKIGGFFGSRAPSVSSMASDASPQMQSNAAHPPQRASVYSFSDSSSLAEPLSPVSGEAQLSHVVIRSSSDAGSMGGSPLAENEKEIHVAAQGVAV